MANEKLTALAALANPTSDDLFYVVDDAGGTPVSKKATLGSGLMSYGVCDGRLTLTTAVPVTTADVTGTATLYYTPYVGDQIGLYNASGTWSVLAFTEKSLSLAGYTASKPYDIFAYDNAGTLALESLIWTDGTTRATALAYQNGILVKSGVATRRYLGTIYVNSAGGLTEDTVTARFVWNYYNRIKRTLALFDASAHSYTDTAARSWNNDASIRVETIVGVLEDSVRFNLKVLFDTTADGVRYVSIGMDSTSTNIVELRCRSDLTHADNLQGWTSSYDLPLSTNWLGYHYWQIQERGSVGTGFANVILSGCILS